MILFFTLLSFIIVVVCCVFLTAWTLKKRTNVIPHFENVIVSFDGVRKVAHDNASKTVESSMLGATNTLSSFGVENLNIDNFYNTLNKKKEQ